MDELINTRGSSNIAWIAAQASILARYEFDEEGEREQKDKLDEAICGQIGRLARHANEDAPLSAARHMVEAAGQAMRAACAFP